MSTTPLSLVFAGGGCRCFWQVGLLEALGADLPPLAELAGVSAGAAMATFAAAGSYDPVVRTFLRLVEHNRANVYPRHALTGAPLFPHEAMYRAALAAGLDGDAWARLQAGPAVRVLHAWVEPGLPVWPTIARALWIYERRKHAHVLHGAERPPAGVAWGVVRAQASHDQQDWVEQIVRSSISPPITRVPMVGGRAYFDGGFVDNVPVRALSAPAQAGKVIVLLTRYDPALALPADPTRLYLAPSAPVPVAKWDYAHADLIRATLDLGRRDAARYRARIDAFLAR